MPKKHVELAAYRQAFINNLQAILFHYFLLQKKKLQPRINILSTFMELH